MLNGFLEASTERGEQGSTYVYLTFVEPFLTTHEAEIDDTIAKTKAQARAAGLDYARRAWLAFRELVLRAILSVSLPSPSHALEYFG